MRKARLGAAIAAAFASLAAAGVQAQEANAWDVEELIGRSESTSMAQLSRQQVLADLRQAREDGTYHAGNEGTVPDYVLERRAMAHQREAERIARAYQDESARQARMSARPSEYGHDAARESPANEQVTTTPVAPVESAVVTPVQPAATTAQPSPSDSGSPPPTPDVRPNQDIATERRTPADSLGTAVPPRGEGPPAAPGSEAAQPPSSGGDRPQPDSAPTTTTPAPVSNDPSPAARMEQQLPPPQGTQPAPSAQQLSEQAQPQPMTR